MRNQIEATVLAAALLSVTPLHSAEAQLAQAGGQLLPANQQKIEIASYEETLAALHSERRKFKTGRSQLFVVSRAARDLRDAELRMSTTAPQRIAALVRHVALMRELADEAVTALDQAMSQKWLHDAESALKGQPQGATVR